MSEVVQNWAPEEEMDQGDMIADLAFSVVFFMVSSAVLTMRMDYYHFSGTSGVAFEAQMAN